MMDISLIFYGVFAALGYVLLQSLFILGIRMAAAGTTEIQPDGKHYDSEMILYPIFKFITQTTKQKVFFTGTQFIDLVKKIQILLPEKEIHTSNETLLWDNSPEAVSLRQRLNEILPKIDAQIQIELTGEGGKFYKVYDKYRFNKYLRKPVIQCPICMASYYSILSYWIPVWYCFGFSWTALYLWVANVCAVSYVNWIIFNKNR